jgi:hypothetical protein
MNSPTGPAMFPRSAYEILRSPSENLISLGPHISWTERPWTRIYKSFRPPKWTRIYEANGKREVARRKRQIEKRKTP